MIIRQTIYDIDLSKELKRIFSNNLLAMNDKLANRMGARVFQDGQAVILAGYTVKGYFIRNGIETLILDGAVDGNTAYVDLDAKCYHRDGNYTLTVKLCRGETEQTLVIFNGRIVETITDTIIENENTLTIADLVQQDWVERVLDAADTAMEQASIAAESAAEAQAIKESMAEMTDKINKTSEVALVRNTEELTSDSYLDGYYSAAGVFVPDAGREYKILSVQPGEVYELSTTVGSMAIPAIIYRDASDGVLFYDMLGANGTYEKKTAEFTIPDDCSSVIVQSVYYVQPTDVNKVIYLPNQSCKYIEQEEIALGPDILSNVHGYYAAGTNWSGDKTTGYTHAAGRADSISFSTNSIEEGAVYLCDFDTDYTEDEFVNVGIGSQYRIPVYKGISHLSIPLLAVGAKTLYFTPLSNRTFTISNVTLRKVGGMDAKQNIELFNVLTSNHSKNLGYWNVLLGKNTAENAVGTTRTLAIGYAALNALQGGHRNVALGTFTMSQMIGGENNVAIGADAMLAIKQALDCIAIGKGAMYNGQLVEDNVAIGHYALTGSASSSNSKRNVAIGKNAGWYAYGQDNVYIGYQAGYKNRNTNGNVCIGKNAYGGESGNHNTCIGEESGHATGINNSTAIGYYAQATKSNQMVLGNASVNEVVIAGKLVKFNADGTVTWENQE